MKKLILLGMGIAAITISINVVAGGSKVKIAHGKHGNIISISAGAAANHVANHAGDHYIATCTKCYYE